MDEPTWMVYAGFIFDALASVSAVVAIVLAVKAYRVAVDSHLTARRQHQKVSELEVLRALLGYHQRLLEEITEDSGAVPSIGVDIGLQLATLDPSELPLWSWVYAHSHETDGPSRSDFIAALAGAGVDANSHDEDIHFAIWQDMGKELQRAIGRRMK
ncbi:hypothetical protein AB0F93_14080 [Micromonospora tulbaghiae]|uniref:hypothetical protein n=1 Tax=Micromonospora tulbaghiae TaxID=479978 RepID=UPI0033165F6F